MMPLNATPDPFPANGSRTWMQSHVSSVPLSRVSSEWPANRGASDKRPYVNLAVSASYRLEVCRAARDAVRAEAEKIGRDPRSVESTIRDRGGIDVSTREAREKTIERLLPYVHLGATHPFLFLAFEPAEKVGETV